MRHAQLRAFHHVALGGGFSRAAEMLGLTQPAVSDQVRRLERDYDTVLFDRRKRQVHLTRAGEALFEVTRRLFSVEEEARNLLGGAAARGQLRIVADSTAHVLGVLAAFRARHPEVVVRIRSGNSDQVLAQLHAVEADLGVVAELPSDGAVHGITLGQSPLIAFGARGTCKPGPVRLVDLAVQPLVMREPGSKTRSLIEAAFVRAGLTPQIAIEAEGREAVRELVAAGAGLGIVSAAEFGQDRRLVSMPLSDCSAVMTESLICLTDRKNSPWLAKFLQLAARRPGR